MKLASDDGDSVELEPKGEPGDADLELTVRVARDGFQGVTTTWIARHDWFAFAQALVVLEERRTGEARVASMSPDELELIVRSTDRPGHFGVEGLISKCEFDRKISLRFSVFSFDAGQIVSFAREALSISEKLGATRSGTVA